MAAKTRLMLIALGLACLLQAAPTEASNEQAKKLLRAFQRLRFDETKKSFYLHAARYGVQVHLRQPLVQQVLGIPDDSELSDLCLNQMVAKVEDLEVTFYDRFSTGCESRDQYTVECLEAAKPEYFNGLMELRSETEECFTKNR